MTRTLASLQGFMAGALINAAHQEAFDVLDGHPRHVESFEEAEERGHVGHGPPQQPGAGGRATGPC